MLGKIIEIRLEENHVVAFVKGRQKSICLVGTQGKGHSKSAGTSKLPLPGTTFLKRHC